LTGDAGKEKPALMAGFFVSGVWTIEVGTLIIRTIAHSLAGSPTLHHGKA